MLKALLSLVGCVFLSGCAYVPGTASPYQQYRQRLAAQRALDRASESAGAENAEARPTLAERLEEGDRAKRAGDLPRAMLAYLQAYQLDPTDRRSRERIAFLHLAKDPQRAELIFTDLSEEDPSWAVVRLGLGLSLLSQGRTDAARASLEQAIALDSNLAIAYYALSIVYEMQGHTEAAYAYADRASTLDPRDASIVGNLGVSQMVRGNYDEAERALRRAVLLDPRTPSHRNNLGVTLGMMKRYDEALREFRAGGTEQSAQNNLGYVYFLNGEYAKATEHYEAALLAPGDDDEAILANLHRVLDQIDRTESSEPAAPIAIVEPTVVVAPAVVEAFAAVESAETPTAATAPAPIEAAATPAAEPSAPPLADLEPAEVTIEAAAISESVSAATPSPVSATPSPVTAIESALATASAKAGEATETVESDVAESDPPDGASKQPEPGDDAATPSGEGSND